MQSLSIELLGITIAEPVSLIVNSILAVFCFLFGHLIFHRKQISLHDKRWSIFFLIMGIAFLLGGISHGFTDYELVSLYTQNANRLISGLAIFFAQFGSIVLVENQTSKRILTWLIVFELILFSIFVFYFNTFNVVLINTAIGLLLVTSPIQLNYYWRKKLKSNLVIVIGIVSNIVPAVFFVSKLSINNWLNHVDISHLLMIICFYIIYKGIQKED